MVSPMSTHAVNTGLQTLSLYQHHLLLRVVRSMIVLAASDSSHPEALLGSQHLVRACRYGSWGVCFTYGTWFGVEALTALGETFTNSPVLLLPQHICYALPWLWSRRNVQVRDLDEGTQISAGRSSCVWTLCSK